MPILAKKLYVQKEGQEIKSANIYSEVSEMISGQPYLSVKFDETINGYVPLNDLGSSDDSLGRVDVGGSTKQISMQAVIPYGSQRFNSSGTFNVPVGAKKLRITAAGAGGGGAGGNWSDSEGVIYDFKYGPAGGNGQGKTSIVIVSANSYSVVVGTGGAPAAYVNGTGANGGYSSCAGVTGAGGGGSSRRTGAGVSYSGGAAGGAGGYGDPYSGGWLGSAGANGWVIIEWGKGVE